MWYINLQLSKNIVLDKINLLELKSDCKSSHKFPKSLPIIKLNLSNGVGIDYD